MFYVTEERLYVLCHWRETVCFVSLRRDCMFYVTEERLYVLCHWREIVCLCHWREIVRFVSLMRDCMFCVTEERSYVCVSDDRLYVLRHWGEIVCFVSLRKDWREIVCSVLLRRDLCSVSLRRDSMLCVIEERLYTSMTKTGCFIFTFCTVNLLLIPTVFQQQETYLMSSRGSGKQKSQPCEGLCKRTRNSRIPFDGSGT